MHLIWLALAWLIVLIVAYAGAALISLPLLALSLVGESRLPIEGLLVVGTLLLLDIVGAVALLFLKAWGFAAYVLIQMITVAVVPLFGGGIAFVFGIVLVALLSTLILFAVLRVGNPSTWSQLT